ncbi:MAG: peptide chain release factor 2 [Succinivibrio sp.]|uniref:Peptide chain release factor 2 n=1 Tax=Succinivibrio faecicola TaxID=2820300 RepID=A0ABS7DHV6_9GAMM|nr:peptide chain release factor 2 [Succinivibrio sp.]MBW7570880.1 peptide chain release factor 2 [Succinivibrio faecicola]MCI6938679.1 peptide chain release factor 2 [Succinatimonas hippei]MDD6206615.1 peptide chain release factor 2 [Succinivibrio sp.]
MLETISVKDHVAQLRDRADALRGYLDLQSKQERLEEVNGLLEDPKLWDDPAKAQELGKERQTLTAVVSRFKDLYQGLDDVLTLDEMAREENSDELTAETVNEVERLEGELVKLELERMFSGPNDNDPCYMDIQSGSGGTEAQDWAEMVMRMYLKFGEKHGFKVTVEELSEGEVAGIKSATLRFEGDHAYGYFRTETGVHRLVRKSPFDSNNRRHTSFCSAYVYPEIDDNIEVEINPADLKVDVYRSSGAGGQHVNKTESAVRITHVPTGIVVSCQNERSQFQNRDQAMKQLRARLYTLELEKRQSIQKEIEDSKSDIGWGSQIRSYVLDDARIKDLRTGVECRDTSKVLNGDLDQFIEASLKSGL